MPGFSSLKPLDADLVKELFEPKQSDVDRSVVNDGASKVSVLKAKKGEKKSKKAVKVKASTALTKRAPSGTTVGQAQGPTVKETNANKAFGLRVDGVKKVGPKNVADKKSKAAARKRKAEEALGLRVNGVKVCTSLGDVPDVVSGGNLASATRASGSKQRNTTVAARRGLLFRKALRLARPGVCDIRTSSTVAVQKAQLAIAESVSTGGDVASTTGVAEGGSRDANQKVESSSPAKSKMPTASLSTPSSENGGHLSQTSTPVQPMSGKPVLRSALKQRTTSGGNYNADSRSRKVTFAEKSHICHFELSDVSASFNLTTTNEAEEDEETPHQRDTGKTPWRRGTNETPRRRGTDTPRRGGTDTSHRRGTDTPRRRDTDTSRRGGTYTLRPRGTDTPRRGVTDTPRRRDRDTPRRGGTYTFRPRGTDTPRGGVTDTPRRRDRDTPRRRDTDKIPRRKGTDTLRRGGTDTPRRKGSDTCCRGGTDKTSRRRGTDTPRRRGTDTPRRRGTDKTPRRRSTDKTARRRGANDLDESVDEFCTDDVALATEILEILEEVREVEVEVDDEESRNRAASKDAKAKAAVQLDGVPALLHCDMPVNRAGYVPFFKNEKEARNYLVEKRREALHLYLNAQLRAATRGGASDVERKSYERLLSASREEILGWSPFDTGIFTLHSEYNPLVVMKPTRQPPTHWQLTNQRQTHQQLTLQRPTNQPQTHRVVYDTVALPSNIDLDTWMPTFDYFPRPQKHLLTLPTPPSDDLPERDDLFEISFDIGKF